MIQIQLYCYSFSLFLGNSQDNSQERAEDKDGQFYRHADNRVGGPPVLPAVEERDARERPTPSGRSDGGGDAEEAGEERLHLSFCEEAEGPREVGM